MKMHRLNLLVSDASTAYYRDMAVLISALFLVAVISRRMPDAWFCSTMLLSSILVFLFVSVLLALGIAPLTFAIACAVFAVRPPGLSLPVSRVSPQTEKKRHSRPFLPLLASRAPPRAVEQS